MSWTDEQLRGFNALSDQLVAEQQTGSGKTSANGRQEPPGNVRPLRSANSSSQNRNLTALLDALRGYLHLDDDGHVLFALAVAISARLDGDPLWGMIIGPSSGGKTETLRMVDALADERVDELTAASLLSWTKGKSPRPTGILTRVGESGFVTVADFSTVLATSDRGGRDQLFALLRRVYDGCATRDLGNAPSPLRWQGRMTFLAACTPAIDHYSSHADALGPRWLYWRLPDRDTTAKTVTGRRAYRASELAGHRAKAADLARGVVTAAVSAATTLTFDDGFGDTLVDVAVAAGYGRAAVPRSGYGQREIEGMPVIEDPPRLVGQLLLLARGLTALGLDRAKVLGMCTQAALHSIPQQRLAVLQALMQADEYGLGISEIARRAGCHRHVARFALEELECVGITRGPDEDDSETNDRSTGLPSVWRLEGDNTDLIRSVLKTTNDPGTKSGLPPSTIHP